LPPHRYSCLTDRQVSLIRRPHRKASSQLAACSNALCFAAETGSGSKVDFRGIFLLRRGFRTACCVEGAEKGGIWEKLECVTAEERRGETRPSRLPGGKKLCEDGTAGSRCHTTPVHRLCSERYPLSVWLFVELWILRFFADQQGSGRLLWNSRRAKIKIFSWWQPVRGDQSCVCGQPTFLLFPSLLLLQLLMLLFAAISFHIVRCHGLSSWVILSLVLLCTTKAET
jgi:hypothetical protein